MNRDAAKTLADEYHRTGATTLEYMSFTIPGTNDEILIVVTRSQIRYRQNAIKSFEEATRSFTPTAAGRPCPACGGTGRV